MFTCITGQNIVTVLCIDQVSISSVHRESEFWVHHKCFSVSRRQTHKLEHIKSVLCPSAYGMACRCRRSTSGIRWCSIDRPMQVCSALASLADVFSRNLDDFWNTSDFLVLVWLLVYVEEGISFPDSSPTVLFSPNRKLFNECGASIMKTCLKSLQRVVRQFTAVSSRISV